MTAPLPTEPTATDVLAEAVRTDPSRKYQTKLWSATFELDRWWFVRRGEPDNPQPFVGVHQDEPILMAFTTAERARGFAIENGLAPADAEVAVLDHGVSGYLAPLGNLPPIRAHVRGEA
jgi:hypothetical protein